MEPTAAGGDRRLTAADWERAALTALTAGGVEAVLIPRLAAALGATKGSFYWHFPSRDALLTAALTRWEASFTDQRLSGFATAAPADRLRQWLAEAETDHPAQRLHLAIALAATHPVVAPVYARVAAKRVAFIADTLAALGFAPAAARRRAVALHALYLGYLQLARALPDLTGDGDERAATVRDSFAALATPPA
jgi:AcrR family transcriptional regulator